jgi:hypothetical protein
MEEPMSEYGVALTLARYRAKQAVKQRLWDRGVKLSTVTPRDITEWADAMIAEQPQLLAEAIETVRNDPKLRTLAERQARWARRLRR